MNVHALTFFTLSLLALALLGCNEEKRFSATLKDSRDGKFYRTVIIGKQVWMAKNLDYEYNRGSAESFCYDNDPDNCYWYGRLYTWSAAMDSAATFSVNGKGCGFGKNCTPTNPVKGICPEGWHLPTKEDWQTLFKTAGGPSKAFKALKADSNWYEGYDGDDTYGFAAKPAGYRGNHTDIYHDKVYFSEGDGGKTLFWSASEQDSRSAYAMDISYSNDGGVLDIFKNQAISVRCIKD
jgi:uncharacterized protein (TIGR02145 family)